MTIREAIDKASALHPSSFTDEQKLDWLNECEGMVQKLIFRVVQEDLTVQELVHRETGPASIQGNVVTLEKMSDFRVGEQVTVDGISATVESVDFFHKVLTLSAAIGDGQRTITISSDRSNDELMVLFPFDKLYPEYIGARIAYNNNEYDAYQNIMAVFNQDYKEFAAWWQRTYGSRRVM